MKAKEYYEDFIKPEFKPKNMGKVIKMYETPFQQRPYKSYKYRGWINKAYKLLTLGKRIKRQITLWKF